VDAALVEMTSWAIADIAFAFGLDPTTLGVSLSGSMTYTNVRDAWLNHRDFGLAPWLAVVSDTLSALTPTGQTVLVDLDGFENPTRQERYQALKLGIESGVITVDEAREIEGLPPLPDEPKPQPQPLQLVPAGADVTAPAGGDTIPVGGETQA
jgi:phage portal protein BeeE